MERYEITTELKGTEPFLVIRHDNEEDLNDYLLKMIEYNSILGILPLKTQRMNGRTVLNYKLSGKYKITDLINQGLIGSKEAKIIYSRIIAAVLNMKEYFLKASQAVYDVEYLYLDKTLNPYMIYLPFEDIERADLNKTLREFFLSLLSEMSDGKQDDFFDTLMRYLIKPNFNLEEFKRVAGINDAAEEIAAAKEQTTYSQAKSDNVTTLVDTPVSKGVGVTETANNEKKKVFSFGGSETEKKEETTSKGVAIPGKSSSAGVAIPGKTAQGGVTIPGKTANSNTVEEKKKEKKEEKKKFGLFGFGKKKEKEIDGEVVIAESKQSEVQNEESGGEWSKTVMINPTEENRTIILTQSKQLHLKQGNNYIPVSNFPFSIGKSKASYIVNNETVSRLHATITKQGDSYFIQDENSSNHTYVNGQMLQPQVPAEITEGDVLRLSNEEFIVCMK